MQLRYKLFFLNKIKIRKYLIKIRVDSNIKYFKTFLKENFKSMTSKSFDKNTTALEVVDGLNLNGYEIIITGCSSGIGVETARALAKAGASLIITVRDLVKGREVVENLKKDTNNNKIELEELRLDSFKSIYEFIDRFKKRGQPLNILINNAGVASCPLSYTEDGFEMQIGTNHFGHFVLTNGLIPALIEGHNQSGRYSRVINVSSQAHCLSDINYEDVNFKQRPYDKFIAYAQSKTANVLFSIGLTKRYRDHGVVSNALMPGGIMTNIFRHTTQEDFKNLGYLNDDGTIKYTLKTVEQGASTQVWAAVSSELEGKGGLYLENCSISKVKKSPTEIIQDDCGVIEFAVDSNNADKFWNFSESLVNSIPK